MTLLLDTHTLLWFVEDATALSGRAKAARHSTTTPLPASGSAAAAAATCWTRRWRYMPHTVTGASVPGGAGRRKIFCSQVRSGERSNTIRWPASAPHRSI